MLIYYGFSNFFAAFCYRKIFSTSGLSVFFFFYFVQLFQFIPPPTSWHTLSFSFNANTGSPGPPGPENCCWLHACESSACCGGQLGHGSTHAEEPVEQLYFPVGVHLLIVVMLQLQFGKWKKRVPALMFQRFCSTEKSTAYSVFWFTLVKPTWLWNSNKGRTHSCIGWTLVLEQDVLPKGWVLPWEVFFFF